MQKRRKRRIKYIGYVRMTVAALLIITIILTVDSLRRHSRSGNDTSGLTVTLDNPEGADSSDDTIVPDETEPSVEEIPYEKKEIDNTEYRAVVKLKADMGTGNLVMVNKQNPYKFPDNSANMVSVSSGIGSEKAFKVSYNTLQIQTVALENFSNMMKDFYGVFSDGDVTVVAGNVTYAEQNGQYSAPPADAAVIQSENQFAPGFSDHHTGLALDLKLVSSSGSISDYDGTGNYKWINDNCYKYGFIIRYPAGKDGVTGVAGNPAHLRYVGVPHSYIMRDNGFTLEDYMVDLKKYIFGYEHLYYSVYGYDYEIYYVPAETGVEETLVPVPKKEDYSVSGNNCDGFVVTVCRKADGETWQPAAEDAVQAVTEEIAPTEPAEDVLANETETEIQTPSQTQIPGVIIGD